MASSPTVPVRPRSSRRDLWMRKSVTLSQSSSSSATWRTLRMASWTLSSRVSWLISWMAWAGGVTRCSGCGVCGAVRCVEEAAVMRKERHDTTSIRPPAASSWPHSLYAGLLPPPPPPLLLLLQRCRSRLAVQRHHRHRCCRCRCSPPPPLAPHPLLPAPSAIRSCKQQYRDLNLSTLSLSCKKPSVHTVEADCQKVGPLQPVSCAVHSDFDSIMLLSM
jgi:hypothetical protein